MKTKLLGRTELEVPVLGLGTAFLGREYAAINFEPNEEFGIQAIIESLEAGCKLLDTAPLYGSLKSETIIGKALKLRPELKKGLIISTKVGQVKGHRDYSYDAVMRSVEASQQRLGINQFEILFVHDAMNRPMEDVMGPGGALEALRKLQDEGIVNFVGTAANDPDTNGPYMETGEFDVAMVPDSWSLLTQQANRHIFPAAEKHNIGIFLATPLERGLLATGPNPDIHYQARHFKPEIIDNVSKIQELCREFGISLLSVSLQWCLRHPLVSTVIPGISLPSEGVQNIEAVQMEIPEAFWPELEPLIVDWTATNFIEEAKHGLD
ncbi:MAG: hypothetical protein CMI18_14195 [Opitutaceae bacterium]|nr:hypothetical protein [Opitutaceae bacterium]|tara:strand:- start:3526 stop:4494 length:969 start_codon:yes stop_codon:yes gene_type:complete